MLMRLNEYYDEFNEVIIFGANFVSEKKIEKHFFDSRYSSLIDIYGAA